MRSIYNIKKSLIALDWTFEKKLQFRNLPCLMNKTNHLFLSNIFNRIGFRIHNQ
jgi:hypothetical protein